MPRVAALVLGRAPTHRRVCSRAQALLKHHWGQRKNKKRIHLEEHDGKEMFTFAVKVFPLYNQIAVTRVGLMAVFPEAEAKK